MFVVLSSFSPASVIYLLHASFHLRCDCALLLFPGVSAFFSLCALGEMICCVKIPEINVKVILCETFVADEYNTLIVNFLTLERIFETCASFQHASTGRSTSKRCKCLKNPLNVSKFTINF